MILFTKVRLLGFDPLSVSEPTDLLTGDDGAIAAIGEGLAGTPRAEGARKGGTGGYLSPGLVVAHAHLYSTLARGMRVAIGPAKDFGQLLERLWWRLDRALDTESVRASALAGAAEAALRGVTAIVDHHASPGCVDGSLSVIADAVGDVGLRSVLCYETSDRNGRDGAWAGLRENGRWAAECAAERRPGQVAMKGAMIGAHASFTLEDDTLEALGDLVRSSGVPFHIHAAEDRYDASDSRARRGLDPVARLDRYGCLARDSIVAHGLYLSQEELDLMAERGVHLAHNARSNMNNGVGYASLLPRSGGFLLGTDGLGADLPEELRFAYFKHRDSGGSLGPEPFARALGRNSRFAASLLGRGLLSRSLRTSAGALLPGSPADLVHWDYEAPTPVGADNLASHLAFGMSTRDIRSTLVAGRFITENRIPAFDSAAIAAKANEEAVRLWKRMEEGKGTT